MFNYRSEDLIFLANKSLNLVEGLEYGNASLIRQFPLHFTSKWRKWLSILTTYVKQKQKNKKIQSYMLITVEKCFGAVLPYSILMPPRLPDICHCCMVWSNLVSWHENICLTEGHHHLFFHRIQVGFVVLYHKALNTVWTEIWVRVSRLD